MVSCEPPFPPPHLRSDGRWFVLEEERWNECMGGGGFIQSVTAFRTRAEADQVTPWPYDPRVGHPRPRVCREVTVRNGVLTSGKPDDARAIRAFFARQHQERQRELARERQKEEREATRQRRLAAAAKKNASADDNFELLMAGGGGGGKSKKKKKKKAAASATTPLRRQLSDHGRALLAGALG